MSVNGIKPYQVQAETRAASEAGGRSGQSEGAGHAVVDVGALALAVKGIKGVQSEG